MLSPLLSIITPVLNGGDVFRRCLAALQASDFKNWELIVVDDGSTDRSAEWAREAGAVVLKTSGRLGPGAARNHGARVARGDYLCFIDADCQVHPDTLSKIAQHLEQEPELEALFGSYDDMPAARNFVAQFKNLFHHYVHQTGRGEASTFWAGAGVIRRTTFLALGGFDVRRYPRASIEDIDLGYRLRQAGGRIRLAKDVLVTHHKAWTLVSMIKSDVLDRGIPWTRLMLRSPQRVNDLNLGLSSRLSIVAVYAWLAALLATLLLAGHPWFLVALFIAVSLAVFLLILNWDVYRFFHRKRGIWFAVRAGCLHWLYYFYCLIAYAGGVVLHGRDQVVRPARLVSEPLIDDRS